MSPFSRIHLRAVRSRGNPLAACRRAAVLRGYVACCNKARAAGVRTGELVRSACPLFHLLRFDIIELQDFMFPAPPLFGSV